MLNRKMNNVKPVVTIRLFIVKWLESRLSHAPCTTTQVVIVSKSDCACRQPNINLLSTRLYHVRSSPNESMFVIQKIYQVFSYLHSLSKKNISISQISIVVKSVFDKNKVASTFIQNNFCVIFKLLRMSGVSVWRLCWKFPLFVWSEIFKI